MTPQEHQLMVMMFARMNEAIGIVFDTFKSNGIWKEGDQQAFAAEVRLDREKSFGYFAQALADYTHCAASHGVETGLPTTPPSP